MAKRAAAAGYQVTIVTGDKDFFQLVGDGIDIFNPRDEGTWYDAAGVKEKFGVEPGNLGPDATLTEFGLDSLTLVELIFAIEEHFGVEIADDADIGSLKDLARLIDALRSVQIS